MSDVLAIWGLVIGVLGLLATGIGFWIAIFQLRKTATAAQATTRAIELANGRMLLNHLLVLLPQMKNLEADLDAAIAAPDKIAAIRALVAFSHTANQVAALLETEVAQSELVAQLRASARAASLAKSDLVSGSKKSLPALLHEIVAEISDVAAKCAGLSTTYQTKVA